MNTSNFCWEKVNLHISYKATCHSVFHMMTYHLFLLSIVFLLKPTANLRKLNIILRIRMLFFNPFLGRGVIVYFVLVSSVTCRILCFSNKVQFLQSNRFVFTFCPPTMSYVSFLAITSPTQPLMWLYLCVCHAVDAVWMLNSTNHVSDSVFWKHTKHTVSAQFPYPIIVVKEAFASGLLKSSLKCVISSSMWCFLV